MRESKAGSLFLAVLFVGYIFLTVPKAVGIAGYNEVSSNDRTEIIAYWNCDEGSGSYIYDVVSYGYYPTTIHRGTLYGSVSFVSSVFYKALYFPSTTTSYVSLGASPDFKRTGDLVIEAWIKTSSTGTYKAIFDGFKRNSGVNYGYSFYIHSNNKLAVVMYTTGGSGIELKGSTMVTDGKWHYVAVRFSRPSIELYVDGILDGNATWDHSIAYYTTHNFQIGRRYDTSWGAHQFVGYIDEIKFSCGEKTVGATIGFWNFNENIGSVAGDKSPGLHNGTLIGSVSWNSNGKFNESCIYFSGSSGYVNIGAVSEYKLKSTLTVEAWIKTSSTGTYKTIFDGFKRYSGVNYGYSFYIHSNNKLAVVMYTTGGSGIELKGSTVVTDGKWHYVAVRFDRPSIELYVDGVLDGNATWDHNIAYYATHYFQIGRRYDTSWGAHQFIGYIDEVRLSNYKKVIGSFIARYSFEETITNDDSFGYNDIDYCSATRTAAGGKFGDYRLQFDGINDYARVDDIADNNRDVTFNGESFTIELWIKPTSLGSDRYSLIYKGDSSTTYYEVYIEGSTGRIYFGVRLGSGWTQWVQSPSNAVSAGNLYHITAIWDENMKIMSLYMNGHLVDYYRTTSSSASSTDSSTTSLYIGYSPMTTRTYFCGYMDEIVIFNYPKYLHNDIDGDCKPDIYEAENLSNLYDAAC